MTSISPNSSFRKKKNDGSRVHLTPTSEEEEGEEEDQQKKSDDSIQKGEKRRLLPERPTCECECLAIDHPLTGYICAIISALLFTTHALLFKLNENILHFSNALFSRMSIGVVFMSLFILCCRDAFIEPWDDLKWILLSAVLFTGSSVFFYVATTMMPFADVIAIFFTQCGPTVIFAWLYLHEPFGIYEVGILVSALVGVLLVAHPPDLFVSARNGTSLNYGFNTTLNSEYENYLKLFDIKILDRIFASLVAFTATLCASANIVVLRRLTNISVFTINFYVSILGVTVAAIMVSTLSSWKADLDSVDDYVLVAAQSFSGLIAGLLLIVATRYVEAGVISVLLTLEIVFAYVVQMIVLDVKPTASAAIGAILITVVCIIYGLKSYMESRADDGITKSMMGRRTSHW